MRLRADISYNGRNVYISEREMNRRDEFRQTGGRPSRRFF